MAYVAHLSSYSVGAGGLFPLGEMFLGFEADHSHVSGTKVKDDWNYTSSPPYAFMVCRETTQLCFATTIVLCF